MIVGNDALRPGADALAHVTGSSVDGDGVVDDPQYRLVEPDVHHLCLAGALRVP